MAKRDPEYEATDEVLAQEEAPTVGERLRAAREANDLSLEDVAAQTRIPQRHLESIERSDWDSLPAPTYTTGFAKSYATIVGLDRTDIGDQLRVEMGGQRFTANPGETFEPADPRRTMPKWLVLGTIAGLVVLVVLMTWLNNRSLEQPDEANTNPPVTASPATPTAAPRLAANPAPAGPAQGPVVLTATEPAWIQVTDQGASLFQGELAAGQSYTVPPAATAPELKAGKPEALQVKVGSAVAPPVGPAGKVAAHVSLKPADLMRGGAPANAAPTAPAPAAPTPAE